MVIDRRLAWLAAVILGVIVASLYAVAALAHDSWISQGGLKNSAGEWCCGEGDCFVVPADQIKITTAGYLLFGTESIPFREAQPSPDGAYWRCKRPDGTRRCFFAPPPGA